MSDHDIVMITAMPSLQITHLGKFCCITKLIGIQSERTERESFCSCIWLSSTNYWKQWCWIYLDYIYNSLLCLMDKYIASYHLRHVVSDCIYTLDHWTYVRKAHQKRNTPYKVYKTSRCLETYNNFKCRKDHIQTEYLLWNSYWRYINNLILPANEEFLACAVKRNHGPTLKK